VRRRLPWFARLRIRKEPETAYGDYSADQKDGLRRQTNRRRHTREVLLCACGQAPVNHPASVSERVWRVIVTWCMSCAKFKLNCSTATRPSSGQPWPQAKHHNPSAITQYCTIAIPTPTGWVPAPPIACFCESHNNNPFLPTKFSPIGSNLMHQLSVADVLELDPGQS